MGSRGSSSVVGVHLGLRATGENDTADVAGLSLRWRARLVEIEAEVGRCRIAAAGVIQRSLAGTLYLNLGSIA